MPQNPLNLNVKTPSGGLAPSYQDANGALVVNGGATSAAYNLTSAQVLLSGAGTLNKVSIIAGGTATDGAFVLNDAATTGAATSANEIASIPAGLSAGTVVTLDWPVSAGIVLSAVPSAGSPIAAASFRPLV